MSGRTKYLAMGAVALVVTLAGGLMIGNQIASAQGPGGGPGGGGRFGRPGGPGGPGGPGRPMERGGPGMMGQMMLGRLNLTDAQREQVKQIVDSHKDEQKVLGDRARAAREALDQATTAGAFDEGTLRARAADLAAVEADMLVLNARIQAQVFQILTGDQRSELEKMRAQGRERQQRMRRNPPQGSQTP